MSTTISVLGGVGLFLLGMTVMTGGLNPHSPDDAPSFGVTCAIQI